MNVRCAWWNTVSSLEAQTDGAHRKKCFSSQLPNRDHRLQRSSFHLNNGEHIYTQARRKTCATVFKTGLWSSGQADRCIWAAVITPRCYTEVASIQEAPAWFLALLLQRFSREPVGFCWRMHHIWRSALKPPLLHTSCPLHAKHPPKPSTHNPQPTSTPSVWGLLLLKHRVST